MMENIMQSSTTDPEISGGKRKVPFMVRFCGWLLAAESVTYFLLGVYHFHLNNGSELFSRLFSRWIRGDASFTFSAIADFTKDLVSSAASTQLLLIALIESAVLFILTILALWTAVGFFRRWPIAWTTGLFVQASAMAAALILYFINRPRHVIIMMVTGIFMVLYLNYADVHTFFNVPRQDRRRSPR